MEHLPIGGHLHGKWDRYNIDRGPVARMTEDGHILNYVMRRYYHFEMGMLYFDVCEGGDRVVGRNQGYRVVQSSRTTNYNQWLIRVRQPHMNALEQELMANRPNL